MTNEELSAQIAILREALVSVMEQGQDGTWHMPGCIGIYGYKCKTCCNGAEILTQTEPAAKAFLNDLRRSWALSAECEAQQREETARQEEREGIALWLENQTWHEIPADPSCLAMEIRALAEKVGSK